MPCSRQSSTRTRRTRFISGLTAVAILCFQLALVFHVYAHPLDPDEVYCQTCLVGHHAAPPVAAATTAALPPMATAPLPVAVAHVPKSAFHPTRLPRAPPAISFVA